MSTPMLEAAHRARSSAEPAASLGRPGLAAVTLAGGGDGVAYVGRLLARALADLATRPVWKVTLDPAATAGVSRAERARFAARLAAGQLARRADWVLFNHVGIARAQRLVPAAVRRPYGIFLHGIEAWDPAVVDASRRATLRGAVARLANSGYTARRVAAALPDIGPVVACPLALLPSEAPADELDRELLARVGPRAALIVGRMSQSERYKGHDELLDCWPLVRAAVPDAQLVVAGRGDDLDRLRGRAAELGLGDAVLFAGFVSDATLEALFRRAALFAMPSRGEGFGLVYLEAMRRGLPCVASRHDAAVDVVAPGETGLLVDQDDRRELAAAIARLLLSPAEARAMGAAGRRRFEAHFTYERFLERLAPVLGAAFGSHGKER